MGAVKSSKPKAVQLSGVVYVKDPRDIQQIDKLKNAVKVLTDDNKRMAKQLQENAKIIEKGEKARASIRRSDLNKLAEEMKAAFEDQLDWDLYVDTEKIRYEMEKQVETAIKALIKSAKSVWENVKNDKNFADYVDED